MANSFCGDAQGHVGRASYGLSLAATTRWWSAMLTGALYDFTFSLVIYLAKGPPKSGDAAYVIPSGIITGGLIGLFIVMWAIKTI